MLQARGADPRLYNPDRDLLWAMPRLISTALHMLGENITSEHIREMMAKRNIKVDLISDELLYAELKSFIEDMAKFLNDMKDVAAARARPEEWLNRLFRDGDRAGIRAFIADLLVCAMFAEIPIWFSSVQPDKANSPLPDVEKVQDAVESILRRKLDGGGASDE